MSRLARAVITLLFTVYACSAPDSPDGGVADAGTGGGALAGGTAGGLAGGTAGGLAGGIAGGGALAGGSGGGQVCSRNVGGADYRTATQFITSATVAADFGGVAAATTLCNLAAQGAGLQGAFTAWLTADTRWPGADFMRNLDDGPDLWVGPDDPCTFGCGATLRDEHGRAAAGARYWSGFETACVAAPTCSGWRSRDAGTGFASTFGSTTLMADMGAPRPCAERHRLLCRSATQSPVRDGGPPGPRRLAFVTSQRFTGSLGGLAGADRTCTDVARDAGLTPTVRAFLSVQGAAAPTRFAAAAPWAFRGVSQPVFPTVETLQTTPALPLRLDERGATLDAGAPIWTGTDTWARATGLDCAGWTSDAGTGTLGRTGAEDDSWLNDGEQGCSASAHLLCLED